jgi:hypothetical protein
VERDPEFQIIKYNDQKKFLVNGSKDAKRNYEDK